MTVPGAVLAERTDYDDADQVVHHYIQLGWSSTCHPPVTSETNRESWVLGDPRIVRSSRDQYNFAVWALDDNNNGTADFEEKPYTLHYDLNGGAGKAPDDQKDLLPGINVTLKTPAPTPTRQKAIFLGWSLEPHDPITSKADAERWKPAESIKIPEQSAQPGKDVITVYALWAINENETGDPSVNRTPDYLEQHTLTYAENPMVEGGEVKGMPEPPTERYDYGTEVTVTDAKPTHSDVNGKRVVFVGWSTEGPTGHTRAGDSTVYHAGDTIKIGAFDQTLYAVWAFWQPPAPGPAGPGSSGGTAPEPDEADGTDLVSGGSGGAAAPGAGWAHAVPRTGDGFRPEIWAALFALSAIGAAGMALLLLKRRRAANAAPARRAKGSARHDRRLR